MNQQGVGITGTVRYRYQCRSDQGLVRAHNEDALLVDPDLGLFGVCDGLGGHAAGEVASSLAVETLRQSLLRTNGPGPQALVEAIREANLKILEDQQQHPERRGMGTTLSLLLLSKASGLEPAWIAHIGDSRIYLLRGNRLQQLTEDHSPVFRLFRQGKISKEEMRNHPHKSLLEQALGLGREIEPDLLPVDLQAGDRFLVCTDGLTDALADSEIAGILLSEDWDRLTGRFVREANDRGGLDNITLVILEILQGEKESRAEPPASA